MKKKVTLLDHNALLSLLMKSLNKYILATINQHSLFEVVEAPIITDFFKIGFKLWDSSNGLVGNDSIALVRRTHKEVNSLSEREDW